MNKKIIIENELLAESVVSSIMENFPEASEGNALRCTGWHYRAGKFEFLDTEESKRYTIGPELLRKAWALLFSDKWPKGCTPVPESDLLSDWDNWLCQADAMDFDAFVQLACLGEVVYG